MLIGFQTHDAAKAAATMQFRLRVPSGFESGRDVVYSIYAAGTWRGRANAARILPFRRDCCLVRVHISMTTMNRADQPQKS